MKLKFLPLREEFKPSQHTVYIIIFKLGIFKFTLQLLDSQFSNLSNRDKIKLQNLPKQMSGRYFSILILNHHAWIWHTSHDLEEAEIQFKRKLQELKEGEYVEFHDVMKAKPPVRVSYRSIEFIW